MSTLIHSEHSNGIAVIKLNRPDKFNSFTREMSLQLHKALDAAASDDTVRVIYLTGEGKGFCAGQDLSEAIDPNGPSLRQIVTEHYNPTITRLRSIEKPVVCAVNGIAAGAGANIALACDIVLATASASFIQAFSKIGLIPDSGGTYILPRLIGYQRAAALMMTGDKVTAAEAQQMGMIYKVYDDATFAEESMKFAGNLAQMPTYGIGLTKRLLNSGTTNSLEQQLEEEANVQVLAAQSHDFKEGVQAFLEKRKPVFTGK